jgi:hypothetical protein
MARPDGGLRALIRRKLPSVHWTSIESAFTEGGIPDLHGCYDGSSFWIECKVARGNVVRIRPAQIGWLQRQRRCGGRAVLAVRQGDALWLVDGGAVGVLAQEGLAGVPASAVLGHWGGPAGSWPWDKVLAALATAPTAPTGSAGARRGQRRGRYAPRRTRADRL